MGPRRAELIGDTLRRFVRRGARANLSKLLGKTRPEDVALQFRGLTPAEQITVFQILVADYPEGSGAVLTELESPQQQALLEELSPQQLATVLDSMSVDDAVSLVESLPPELHDKVLEVVDLKDLAEVQTHLTYGDDTAGRLMVPEYVALSEDKTVGDAIAFIQQTTELDNVFYLYVVDRDGHLVGVTSLRQLLLSPPARTLDQ
ncbi:MAG: CBS domain-containing protein, partial [Thermoanaerobaculia bacterium]